MFDNRNGYRVNRLHQGYGAREPGTTCLGSMLTWVFAVVLLLIPTVTQAVMPFHELTRLEGKPSFWYEQRRLPRPLRQLLMTVQLSAQCKDKPAKWCKRIKGLLGDTSLPRSTHYIAYDYAPNTYECIRSMCDQLKIEAPLVFISPRGGQAQTVNLLLLSGGFHALVFDANKLMDRSVQECKAVVAHELAHIARRHRQKEKVARYVWPSAFSAVVAMVASFKLYRIFQKGTPGDRWEQFGTEAYTYFASWAPTLGVAGITWVISEIVQAHIRRKHEREADKLAAKAFDGNVQTYMDCLQRVETDEVAAHQRKHQEFSEAYAYVQVQIEQLRDYEVPTSVVAFFNNYLRNRLKKPRPIINDGITGPLDAKPSMDDRLAYLQGLTRKKGK